jgi:hypothetical protein
MAKGERTSLAGWIASLTPFFRRAPTTSTTPTGREGNVAPAVHPTYSFGSQPQNNNQNHSGNDPTALWGNLAASRSVKTDKKIVDRQAASPSSWKTPFIATGRRLPGASCRSHRCGAQQWRRHVIDGNVPVTTVWASRGKAARAEPVSALYEQGKVHHIGTFPQLES